MPTRLEVIYGPMFAGKTEEIFRRIRLEQHARRTVQVIKPCVDTRSEECIASRSIANGKMQVREKHPATIIATEQDLRRAWCQQFDTRVVDEAQFFDTPWFITQLMDLLRRDSPRDALVIVSGLDSDYRAEPFGYMHQLILIADQKTHLTGICMRCYARGASLTQRLQRVEQEPSAEKVVMDDGSNYEVRCRNCHEAFAADEIAAEYLRQPSAR